MIDHCRGIGISGKDPGKEQLDNLTCSRFCRRVIIFLNHHIAVKPVTLETVAENCFAPGNKEKETLGRPRFDILEEILEELSELGFRSSQ